MLAYAPFGKIIPKGLINDVNAELILAVQPFKKWGIHWAGTMLRSPLRGLNRSIQVVSKRAENITSDDLHNRLDAWRSRRVTSRSIMNRAKAHLQKALDSGCLKAFEPKLHSTLEQIG